MSKVNKKTEVNGLVAVAIDKDKNSQYALRWAIDNLLGRGRAVVLLHVSKGLSPFSVGSSAVISTANPASSPGEIDKQTRDLFLSFHCFCTRKDIRCIDVTLKNSDVAKALTEYTHQAAIEHLVLGASRGGIIRKLKQTEKPTIVAREAPDFCTVYIISKSKVSSVRNATRPTPHTSPLQSHIDSIIKNKPAVIQVVETPPRSSVCSNKGENPLLKHENLSFRPDNLSSRPEIQSARPQILSVKPQRDEKELLGRSDWFNDKLSLSDFPEIDTDISFVSSDNRTSFDHLSPLHYDYLDIHTPRLSTTSDRSLGSFCFGQRMSNASSLQDYSYVSQDRTLAAQHHSEDVELEMKRLQQELKQTMEMYNEACKEAVVAREREKKQALELRRWKLEEEKRLLESGLPKEAAMALAEKRRSEMSAQLGDRKRMSEHNMGDDVHCVGRYRRFTMKEIETATNNFSESCKIGEGGYGPVYKCHLDHTRVAVKVLRPDAAQGKTQFQQEVEILSAIRHPNLVLLLGACPEYGCLVYEYMANGSLDAHLFCRGKSAPLGWQVRFRIAADIATGLHFLHQTKPEPIVHRDLKPGNILLDRYFVSKIGDVGLARLVPPQVADQITQYCQTSTAGTFNYIDPEYQQTGLLGVKSDVYSLGIVLLQLLTAKPPRGLAHQVESAVENGTFEDILDHSVTDWPVKEALSMVKIAIQCAQLRRKDRPDLGDVLPELDRLRDFADDTMQPFMFYSSGNNSFVSSQASVSQDKMSDPMFEISAASSSQIMSIPSTPQEADGTE